MSIEFTPAAKDLLAERGYDPVMGARPLRRTIQREIEDPLSEKMLFGDLVPGSIVVVDVEGEGDDAEFTFTLRPKAELPDVPPIETAGQESSSGLSRRSRNGVSGDIRTAHPWDERVRRSASSRSTIRPVAPCLGDRAGRACRCCRPGRRGGSAAVRSAWSPRICSPSPIAPPRVSRRSRSPLLCRLGGLCPDEQIQVVAFERGARVEIQAQVQRSRTSDCPVTGIAGDQTWVDVALASPLGDRTVIRTGDRQPLPRQSG